MLYVLHDDCIRTSTNKNRVLILIYLFSPINMVVNCFGVVSTHFIKFIYFSYVHVNLTVGDSCFLKPVSLLLIG